MRESIFSSPAGGGGTVHGKGASPWGTRVGPVHPSVCGGDDVPPSVPASAWPMQRVGRGLCVPSSRADACPPALPAAGPHSPVPSPEEARGVWRLEGHAGTRGPASAPLLPVGDASSAHNCVPPAGWVAGTAWVLAASWGHGHGVNTLGDDLSHAQSALSEAGGPACHPEPCGC